MKKKIHEYVCTPDSLMAVALVSGASVFLLLAYALGKVSESSPDGSVISSAFAGASFMLAVAGPLLMVAGLAVFSSQWRGK